MATNMLESGQGLETAVLLLVFNRPDTTARVFDAIRAARPRKLYIAADGPRGSVSTDRERVQAVRDLVIRIDWPCELKTLFRSDNLGCKRAVIGAINWFFELEPEGIILEDDCLPHPQFFQYCQEMLQRYRSDERVAVVSGTSLCAPADNPAVTPGDYYFSRHFSLWGWACWRRVWKDYEPEIRDFSTTGQQILQSFPRRYSRHLDALFRREVCAKDAGNWDYHLVYCVWKTGRAAIVPKIRLIQNIGFTAEATHTKWFDQAVLDKHYSMDDRERLTFPLKAPSHFMRDAAYEEHAERAIVGLSRLDRRIVRYLRGRLAVILNHWQQTKANDRQLLAERSRG